MICMLDPVASGLQTRSLFFFLNPSPFMVLLDHLASRSMLVLVLVLASRDPLQLCT